MSDPELVNDARSRVLWGDSKEDVLEGLRQQGSSDKEALELYEEAYRERVAMIRAVHRPKVI